jgi:tetratricopeptide (TPR) repeat protein
LVGKLVEFTPMASENNTPIEGASHPIPSDRQRWLVVAAGVLLIAVGGWILRQWPVTTPQSTAPWSASADLTTEAAPVPAEEDPLAAQVWTDDGVEGGTRRALALMGGNPVARTEEPSVPAAADDRLNAMDPSSRELHQRFQQGAAMLHAKQFQMAMVAFHRVLQLAPELPEAHVNMGFALVGIQEYPAARDFFHGALALRPLQANGYYGLALALEGMEDLEGALGAMRSYIHLTKQEDPFLSKARAALWEWENKLGRLSGLEPLRGGP